MKPSKMRYKEAVHAARDFVYGKIKSVPEHFDERQMRVFEKYVARESHHKALMDELDNEMWLAYTGMTREQYMEGSSRATK